MADELIKSAVLLFIGTSVVLFAVFYFITEGKLKSSALLGIGTAFVLTTVYVYILKNKLESVLGKLYYISTLISENQDDIRNILIPITIYEELEEILDILEETIVEMKDRYENKIRELEMSYEPLLEKSSSLIKYIERLREGYMDTREIPEGIDPVGAMGVALKESVEEIRNHVRNIKALLEELHADFREIEYRIQEISQDKHLEQKLRTVESIINKLEKEVAFFK